MTAEHGRMETRDRSARARRLMEVGMLLVGMLAAAPSAEAADSRSKENDWAQMLGENTEERQREIRQLEQECKTLEGRIASLERRLAEGGMRYTQDPGLRFAEEGQLRDARRELAKKQAAIERLQSGAEKGAQKQAKRRQWWSEAADAAPVLEFADPTLDLSAKKVGNPDIAAYYAKYKIEWKDHQLSFDAQDGTPDGARLALTVGPDFTDADFYFQDGGNDLLVVFTTVTGDHKTLKLDDGYYAGFYESNERGKAVPVSAENE